MPPYKTNEKFRVSEELARKGINLPSSVKLTNINKICGTIRSLC